MYAQTPSGAAMPHLFQPMPAVIWWHEDIIPNVGHEIITHDGEKLWGAFSSVEGHFRATDNRLIRLYNVTHFRRLFPEERETYREILGVKKPHTAWSRT